MRPLAFTTPEAPDLALILALYRTEARDEALRLADEHCKASGHEPCAATITSARERKTERSNEQ